ncbi:3-hydroxyisobutyrate dehydrogenase/glyoxylate/succinic semialdehyde reductase [Pontibacter ummariensis]|uniref:3-hydroxyisobutyrate dehydrogenase/glyoxylate/succinic semialdehyde reductase n=1 Tax=Pontibacter ummariensis TaxID=1610492 RepID=A0A239B5V0_9BACT|nr:NAD(P)-dependent oxidoreductase [Pontibacter ummariensis]PRY16314.1 3-hydroxyisobutyrate dehydrogenase/glyoxylate/succinic semialdehyde reductase [Pontibacter ummariensis]SNS03012.1 3-hydroxyisobutyrate dehydrogenase/glyoxylate/succinic semialdehyde reductase [Pontibacter ummariensis]
MKIGFIGLGIMGSRMAANLQGAGHELVVYNRTQGKADALVENGATRAATPEEVAGQCRLVFTMLSTPEAVEEVALGQDGFLRALPGNSLWVDCSTVNPSFSKKMAWHAKKMGQRFLDAPVSGSLMPAEKGQLIFLVGGDGADLEQVRELMDVMGKAVVHVGDHGQGAGMKMVNNMILGQAMAAFAEALRLGTSLGISEEMLCDTLLSGPAAAPFLKLKQPKLLSRNFSPEFPLEWLHKDLHLASITAYEQNVALPSLQTTKELYALAKQQGLGEEDMSAIYRALLPDQAK